MKVTKQQLKEIVKQELRKVLAEQEEPRAIGPKPTYAEDIPEWYKGPGGVADQLNDLRDMLLDEIKAVALDAHHKRNDFYSYVNRRFIPQSRTKSMKAKGRQIEPEPEPKPAPAIATGGTPKP
jgi:hypothetical protein